MATITKAGAPNKNTKGSIGDIYINSETKTAYKCIFSYGESHLGMYTEWKPVGKVDIPDPIDEKPEPAEAPVKPEKQNRTNYAKHYNK